jgi:hypothetical protein
MDPWWTAQQAGLFGAIGGSAIGVLGALLGTVGGIGAPRGKCKGPVFSLIGIALGLGALSLVAGVVAVIAGQPYHVFYPLLLGGGITSVVFGAALPVFQARYRQADMRRLDAESLRRS